MSGKWISLKRPPERGVVGDGGDDGQSEAVVIVDTGGVESLGGVEEAVDLLGRHWLRPDRSNAGGQTSVAVVNVTTSGRVIWPLKRFWMNASMSSKSPLRSTGLIIWVPEYDSINLR